MTDNDVQAVADAVQEALETIDPDAPEAYRAGFADGCLSVAMAYDLEADNFDPQ